MDVTTITTTGNNDLLRGLRSALDGADSALLCVAFVQSAGVNLLQPQLKRLGPSARLLLTTTFTENAAALRTLTDDLGVQVSVLNPGGGTYHPKVFLARRGEDSTVGVGSSNLTGGLVNNVEAAVRMQGLAADGPIASAWDWGEAL